jgi:long-chain acyl-CoA synthetase
MYTSGTTGRPKGAMLSHRNLVANTWSVMQALKLEPGQDVLLTVLPMFHAFSATVCMLFPLLRGCTFVPLVKFDPQLVANTIQEHGVTILPAVPSMYNVMMRLPEEDTQKLSCLRFCVSGASAMPVALMQDFEARFGKLIYEGDGPTECSPVTCVNPIGGKRKPGSVGLPVDGVQMKILDGQGEELARGKAGEICVRGANVMQGYWNCPRETRDAFFGDWFRTGDIGIQDEDGYFFIVDRIKDLIIVNGMNVYPRIIEDALYRHPDILEAAVVGEPNERHGEIPVAYIVLRQDAGGSIDDIRAHCREQLGRHEIPRKIFTLDELPKNAAGKILKRALRKHGEWERGIDSRAPENP